MTLWTKWKILGCVILQVRDHSMLEMANDINSACVSQLKQGCITTFASQSMDFPRLVKGCLVIITGIAVRQLCHNSVVHA